ncbi:MAG TPA: Fmu (Sun) domain-containing protein [Flavisolibacter sp.]|nr:Fmu (Sun) domain-containing protein [Flavisolibacter sp.]
MRSHSYLNSATSIIASYDGSMPLAAWLKQYFAANKKFGSKDRKEVAHLCYCYYRTGVAIAAGMEEQLLASLYLCSEKPGFILGELKPEWNQQVHWPLEAKLASLPYVIQLENIFPLADALSAEIDAPLFTRSHLVQPDLYVRCRPGKKAIVLQKLDAAGVPYRLVSEEGIAVANATKVEAILEVNREVVVQDLNSQRVLEPLQSYLQTDAAFDAWDCCAASGGKTILLKDRYPSVQITVSDIRSSILANLQKRLREAGITLFLQFTADLSSPEFNSSRSYDLVLCDAPCSGSGTWGRTPEQLRFFREEQISHYASLQKKIALKAAAAVKEGGYLLYITCSVFRQENEELVAYLQQQTTLQHAGSFYFTGYEQKADTLFTALFRL